MNVNERFLDVALLGSAWVLWVLIALSVLSIGIAVERWLTYSAAARRQRQLKQAAHAAWDRARLGYGAIALQELAGMAERSNGPASDMMRVTLEAAPGGKEAIDAIQEATESTQRIGLERSLGLLGSVGANAPFVGLFGTVLEILRVFATIGGDGLGKAERAAEVMSGISEALVATAVGLLVAIPAVVAYNMLSRRLDEIMSTAREVGQITRGAISLTQGNTSYPERG